jgi:hypothetical protein
MGANRLTREAATPFWRASPMVDHPAPHPLCRWFLPAGFLFLLALSQGAQGFEAGAARVEIVPPVPTRMGGYFDRLSPFVGVHDPIYARALVAASGETRVAIVATDLIAVSDNLVAACRKIIEDRLGIPAEHVLICAAHNHSGPTGFQEGSLLGTEHDSDLFSFLRGQIVLAVEEALSSLRPAHLAYRSGHLEGATTNRQQGNAETIDPEVGVLKIWVPETRETIATLFNFTGHPVILGGDNLEISGEYPGEAQRTVEGVLGGVALFTQGACGDVTMQRNGPPFLEVERLGHVLAGEVIKTAELIREKQSPAVAGRLLDLDLEPRELPSIEEAKDLLETAKQAHRESEGSSAPLARIKRLERAMDSAETTLFLAEFADSHPKAWKESSQGSVQVLRIGPLFLVGVPGELFVEYGLEMKQRVRQMADLPMVLVGLANGYNGYFVTPRARATGGYEQAIAFTEVGTGRLLTESAMTLVEEMLSEE